MADDCNTNNRLNDLRTTQLRDALVIAGRLLPMERPSVRLRVLEIDMEELVKTLSSLGSTYIYMRERMRR
jgi:formate-dependent nitrite reductase cytochrome c552 subunit